MHEQTTLADVLAHVSTQQDRMQRLLDELFAQHRSLPYNAPELRALDLRIEKVHGQVLALATICGYLESRLEIDQLNAR